MIIRLSLSFCLKYQSVNCGRNKIMTCDFQFLLINVAMLCNEQLFFKINIHSDTNSLGDFLFISGTLTIKNMKWNSCV